MELSHAPPKRCDCCLADAEGLEFRKIVESEDVGLTIYRYVSQTQNKISTTDGGIFVLQNTKKSKLTAQDLSTVLEHNIVSCPRCIKFIEKAENFLKNVSFIDREDVMGVCDHCARKQRPLSDTCKCQDIVDKFLLEDREQHKQQVKAWLKCVQNQLKNSSLGTRQINKLKNAAQSEISLNDAISKFKKSEYKHYMEDRLQGKIGARAISSLDSLHDTEKFLNPKEFDNLLSPSKYSKQNYYEPTEVPLMPVEQTANEIKYAGPTPESVRFQQTEPTNGALSTTTQKQPHTPVPESVFTDPQEYIKRIMSQEALDKAKVTSFLEPSKELKPEIKPKKTSILKSRADEKVKTEKRGQSKLFTDTLNTGKQKSSSPPPPLSKHSAESFLRDDGEKDISGAFRFSFPKEKVVEQKFESQVSSSELIKNTQDKLQAKTEEEKRKKEEELQKKRAEEERKELERKERKQLALAAKIAEEEKSKAAEEDKLRGVESDKQGLEYKKSKRYDREYQDVAEIPGKTHTTPVSSISSKQKNDKVELVKSSERSKLIIVKEGVDTEKINKQPHKLKEDKPLDQERILKDRGENKAKSVDQQIMIKVREVKQKDDIEKDLEKNNQKSKLDKGKDDNDGQVAQPIKMTQLDKINDNNDDKHPKSDKGKKDENDLQKTKEPKEKADKLEDNTLKSLLQNQQKEKQEQEKMLQEQQKQDELARKKAIDGVKPSNFADKKPRDEAFNRLKEMAVAQERPPSPKKKEEAKNVPELAMREVKIKKLSTDDLISQLVKVKKDDNKDKKVELCNIMSQLLYAHEKHREVKHHGCIICSDSDLGLDFDEREKKMAIKEVFKDVIVGEKIFKTKTPFKKTCDEPLEDIQEMQEIQTEVPKPDAPGPIKKNEEMNVYRMRPAHPEFDWFEHNKYKRVMEYDCGAKLAEIDDSGRGRWYYRSGKLALDYYDAEELNAQQRFVVYSSGEPDGQGRKRPRTILAAFDYLGNGIVFDHTGKIRLKYNQTEGVVLDRSIGPVSHWKWHTLNDPPVLQQVMIDTQMSFKDPRIMKLGDNKQEKVKPYENEEMLAIEFDNFIKEKSRKLTQKFKPFQIKMKALKINEYFSLRVLDQATVYLLFRDGTTNLKINMGMILDHKEIVDTDTAEVGEVSNSLERMPARTDSIAALQQAVAQAQRQERLRVRHERRLKSAAPCASADQLHAGVSRPLHTPLITASTTGSGMECYPHCPSRFKKPSSINLYYDTRV